MHKLKVWLIDMIVMSIPFVIDTGGKYISTHLTKCISETNLDFMIRQSNAYSLTIALTYVSLQCLWIIKRKYAMIYRHELLLYLLLMGNNLIDAVGNYFPDWGINSYDLGINEIIISIIFFLLMVRKGYLNFAK